ncbi:MAG: hypothetical protein ACYDC6_07105 [Acidobacteriaceae bacterium]
MHVNNGHWVVAVLSVASICCQGQAQVTGTKTAAQLKTPASAQQSLPPSIQRAQTVHIPLTAIGHDTSLPVKDLKATDISLDVDGKPQTFELSRPWAQTIDPQTGKPADRPNMLIIVPYAGPQYRKDGIDDAIRDLSAQPNLGWNISILDDGGDQTPYTRNMKTVISNLQRIERENPAETDLDSWRLTASLAIANMRELPGRRVVMTLGDIFHEEVYDGMQLVYENFEAHDVAAAARDAGAVIYAAESFQEIGRLRGLFPYYYTLGFGPWMLLTRDDHFEGWISNLVGDTINEIRQDAMGAYDIDVHLDRKQMDGRAHSVSITPRRQKMILNVPPYYIAPNLRQLQELEKAPDRLRQVLRKPPPPASSPLELATQLEYFPHPDGRSGTQIMTTGFFWSGKNPPPATLVAALQLQQTNSGFMVATTVGRLPWSAKEPIWNAAFDVTPGAYLLRVGAVDQAGKIAAATSAPFTVDPTGGNDNLMISSLVIGKSCAFAPKPKGPNAKPQGVDYLRAGNCDIQPDPSHYYSPQDVLWTLVRITPVAKLANKPSKAWKGSFLIVDVRGTKLAEEPVHWITASDGSFVATTAFQMNDPKLKLVNGQYDVVLLLKGPGVERNYAEDAPFMVYGADEPAAP